MYITKESELFSAHNARQAAVKFNSSIAYEIVSNDGTPIKDEYGNYIFTGKTFFPAVYVKMAKTLDPNIDMSKPIAKGTRVFDWENSIVLKLQNQEVAMISMLSNPYYIMKWNDLLVEEYNNKKNELFTIYHSGGGKDSKSKIFKVNCNNKNGNIQVVLSVTHTKTDGNKDNMWIGLKLHQAHELGLTLSGFLMNQCEYNARFRDFKTNNNSYRNDKNKEENMEIKQIDVSDFFE